MEESIPQNEDPMRVHIQVNTMSEVEETDAHFNFGNAGYSIQPQQKNFTIKRKSLKSIKQFS